MDAAYDMVRDKRPYAERSGGGGGSEVLPCPVGEPPAVEAQWRALAATCEDMTAGDVVMLLELARCLADLEEARRQVTEGGAFVMTKSGDLAENPWADRERKLRAQSVQLRKALHCLGRGVVSRRFVDGAAEAEAEAEARAGSAARAKAAAAKAKAAAKRAAEPAKTKRGRGAAK